MEKELTKYIEKALQQEVEAEFDKLKIKLLEDLEYKKNAICAGILINVMKYVEMERFGDKIIFTIREIKNY